MNTAEVMGNYSESGISQYKFTKLEREWLRSIKNHHSYFLLELAIDNKIKRVYLMEASGAPELTEEDRKTYNFERRVGDEGIKKIKLNRKAFMKFWDKHVTMSFDGINAVEYVDKKSHFKTYKCRPFGWIIDEFEG